MALQRKNATTLNLPVTPVTPVTTKGSAYVSGVIGSNICCDTYDTCCNRSSSSSAHAADAEVIASKVTTAMRFLLAAIVLNPLLKDIFTSPENGAAFVSNLFLI